MSGSAQADDWLLHLIQLVDADMQQVNALILDRITSRVPIVSAVAAHLLRAGGKRLRCRLTLASAQSCGYKGHLHILLATIVEFMHNATLLHDDVVDEGDTRRGIVTARKIWGNQASILVGDFLLGQALCMMAEIGSISVLEVLSKAAVTISEGETMQLAAASNLATTTEEYLKIISAKTAALFSAATELGAVITSSNLAVRDALRDYGYNLGMVFQIIDDILDYQGISENTGKAIGNDFYCGKVTLPVIFACNHATQAELAFWNRTIVDGNFCDNSSDDLKFATQLILKHNAIEDSMALARKYAKFAADALTLLPDGHHKRILLDVVNFSLERTF